MNFNEQNYEFLEYLENMQHVFDLNNEKNELNNEYMNT